MTGVPTSAGFDAILFDLDGTLVDSAPDLGAAADQMRTERGMPSLPLHRYRPMAGAGARGMLGVAFEMTADDPRFLDMREEFFKNYERRMTRSTQVFDGVPALLASLSKRGLAWGIVTNKATRFSEPLVGAIDALSGAAALVSGDTTPYAKPHPAPLLEAARRMNVAPGRCVYVGDDERDVVAGRAAGMFTVAAAWGYLGTAADVNTWGSDAVANLPEVVLQCLPAA